MTDHILLPFSCVDFVQSCHIVDDNCFDISRHRSVMVNFLIQIIRDIPSHARVASTKWDNVTPRELSHFQHILMRRLNSRQGHSLKVTSHDDIDMLYTEIVEAIKYASDTCLPR